MARWCGVDGGGGNAIPLGQQVSRSVGACHTVSQRGSRCGAEMEGESKPLYRGSPMAGRGDCGLGAGPGAESEWVGACVSSCEGYVRGEKPTAPKGTVVTGAKKGLTPPPPADEVEAKNHDVEEDEGSTSGGKSVLVRLGVAMARSGRNDEAAVALLKAVQMGDVGNDDGDGDDAENSLDFEARENLGVVINRSVRPIARSLTARSLPKP